MSEEEEQPGAREDAANAPSEAEADSKPEPKRKKKRRAKKRSEAPEALNADGMERPAFVLDFPDDAALKPLLSAFEAGNYAYVREHAARVAAQSEDADVRAAALELLRRIEPDPLVKFLLGVAFALFVAVVAYVYHAHGG
ncbi:MAG: hypothetical protein QM756_28605 [Polyangiaceae bacterium]